MEKTIDGWVCGALGVVIFSGSMPATRAALAGFDPLFLTVARAALAGLLALVLLITFRQPRPVRDDFVSLAVVAFGVVLGFPLLSALALRHINAAQSQIFLGLLPLATAMFGLLRGGERPRRGFWVFAGLGSACVIGVALRHGADLSQEGVGLMLAAILVCGLGYAEGAKLSRKLGGWQVISWALVLALPVMLTLCWLNAPATLAHVPGGAWAGLAYVAVFSMLVGFVFWYRGLALGGIAAVGQLQLLQPALGLAASALVLHETVPPVMAVATVAIVLCVAGAKRFV
ncbi:MAG TPA: DMT family transporter [Acidocella sp.]|jgi:drug/metabolite transporter (DMT)-like permease|uniref:DMT family transporter n=1 Tax=Acidocella sp. TaxID=50710 RepID=UPI002D0C5E3B|nr:DMT family transporter [Acidocella sp.]HVE20906.1 DMT family transporter [Acidocella sp.]